MSIHHCNSSASLDTLASLIQSLFMTKILLEFSALLYSLLAISWLVHWIKGWKILFQTISIFEKLSLFLFTAGLVLYISQLQIINGEIRSDLYQIPVSWMLFAWSLSAANLSTEIAYGNRTSSFFAHTWTALALLAKPGFGGIFRFTNDLQWLSFHRLCFLLGYAFAVLAIPVTIRYFWEFYQMRSVSEGNKASAERSLWRLDRMEYRLVLWALPLLTAGIITEALILMETNRFPDLWEIWVERRETLLALAAWFLCGIYLHTRLFFGWKHLKAAALYLVGLALLLAGHISHSLWGL